MKLFKVITQRTQFIAAETALEAQDYIIKMVHETVSGASVVNQLSDMAGIDGATVVGGKNLVGAGTIQDWRGIIGLKNDPEFAEFQRLSAKFTSTTPLG